MADTTRIQFSGVVQQQFLASFLYLLVAAVSVAAGVEGRAPDWKSAEVVFDVFGSDGGAYAKKSVVLNGVAIGNLPEAAFDAWGNDLRLPLGPEALRVLRQVNVIFVHNAPGDCFKVRKIAIRAARADGEELRSNVDAKTYSTPPGWSYSEGATFSLKEPLGPFVLSFDPLIPRRISLERVWFCASTRNSAGARSATYRPADGSQASVDLPLPLAVGKVSATLGPLVRANGRAFLRINLDVRPDAPNDTNLLIKFHNPLTRAPDAFLVGPAPDESEKIASKVCDGFVVAALPARAERTAFIPLPVSADVIPPRVTALECPSTALRHTCIPVAVGVEENVGIRYVRAAGVGIAAPAELIQSVSAGRYVGQITLTSASSVRFTVEACDLCGNVAQSDEIVVNTFLPNRLRGVQYSPRLSTLDTDLDHIASLGANVIATAAHQGEAVRRLIAAAHKRSILVFWNMRPNWARYFQAWLHSHPDSIIRASDGRVAFLDSNRDGKKDKAYGCFSSEPFREQVADYAANVMSECEFDGLQVEEPYYYFNDLCYCAHCRGGFAEYLARKYPGAKLKEMFGVDGPTAIHIPSAKERMQYRKEWFEWTEFHVASEMEWLESIFTSARRAAHRAWRKELKYTGYCQGTDRWYMWPGLFTQRLAAPFVTLINSGAYYRKAEGRVEEQRLCLFHAELAGGAARYNGKASMLWVQGWPCKYGLPFTPRDMIIDAMEVFTHGAGTIYLGNVGPKGDPALVDAARQAYGLIKAAEPIISRTRKDATTALFYSYYTLKYDWLTSQAEFNHHAYYLSFLLARAHVPFDIIDTLSPDRLKRYRMLVLDSVTILRPGEIRAIEAWVQAGGALVLLGPCGVQDQYGRRLDSVAWNTVTGSATWEAARERNGLVAETSSPLPNVPASVRYGRRMLEIPQPRFPLKNPPRERQAHFGHTIKTQGKPALQWQEGGTALSIRTYGRGRVMVSGAFPEYARDGDGEALMRAIAEWAGAQRDAPVPPDPEIELVSYVGDADYLVLLINHGREPKRNVRIALGTPKVRPGPVHVFEIRRSQNNASGYAFVKTRDALATAGDEGCTVSLPRLDLFALVHIRGE